MRTLSGALVLCLLATPVPVIAKDIQNACLRSDRSAASRALCTCIQDAANMTLSTKDQKTAAGLFADPHRAQEIRQSDRRSDELFWERYRRFGEAAESFCQS
ncbi:MAG: hypothetical protein AAFN59_03535 [Pseudomonadota bacterium]